jgi:DNA-binding MarR family transcriptional regulator
MADKLTISEILGQIRENWPEMDTPETAVMLSVFRLNDLVIESSSQVLAEFGLSQSAFEALVTLRAQPAPRRMTPTELYRAVLVTSGGMTKVLKQLEAEGCVRREDNPDDQRSRFVCLTRAGEVRAEEAMRAVAEDDRRLLGASLSEQQIAQLGKVLLRTVGKLEDTTED